MVKNLEAPAGAVSLAGILWVLAGAVCFSTKAVMVKLAYQYDIDSVSLLALRFAFSLPVYLFIAVRVGRKAIGRNDRITPRDLLLTALFGLCGYYLASLFDFMGLKYLSAGMERLILFVYPTLVLLLSALFLRKPVTREQLGAVVLTYFGVGLAFVGAASFGGGVDFWWGAGLIFISAFTYAIYLIGSGQLIPRLGAIRFTAYAMVVACVTILIHHALTQGLQLFHFAPMVYVLAFLMAMVATVLPTFLVAEGISRIGAGNAAIVGSVGPFSTIVLEYLLLGETFGPIQWVGALLVIVGVLWLSRKKK